MEATLTTNEVRQISGLASMTLHRWVDEGVVPVVMNGRHGPGGSHQYDLTGVLAATYGARFLRVGFHGIVAKSAAEFVANLGADGVKEAIKEADRKGHNFVAVVVNHPDGRGPRLYSTHTPPDVRELLNHTYADLNSCLDDVTDGIEEIMIGRGVPQV
jgi:hypothetical protein